MSSIFSLFLQNIFCVISVLNSGSQRMNHPCIHIENSRSASYSPFFDVELRYVNEAIMLSSWFSRGEICNLTGATKEIVPEIPGTIHFYILLPGWLWELT